MDVSLGCCDRSVVFLDGMGWLDTVQSPLLYPIEVKEEVELSCVAILYHEGAGCSVAGYVIWVVKCLGTFFFSLSLPLH